MKQKFLLFAAAALMAASALGRPTNLMQRVDGDACERWVDSVYNSLSERERVAQLVFPKAVPTQGPNAKAAIRKFVAENGCGGLLFTSGTLEQYVEMTNYAQSIAKVPLMMTFDGEWGLSMRISNTPKFPCNMALGAISDTALLRSYGREMARQCRLAGIQVNYAPVLDVNSNPRNPVIGYRSFGEDPAHVAALGTAYSLGLEDGGVQAVGKHFPGHGDTATDSHKERTIVTHSADVLNNIDLVPFRDFIDNGLSGIMIGHIVVPALDSSELPATLSKPITTGLLRDKMGFEGLIHTDALSMKGVQVPGLQPALEALKAGADVLESSVNGIADIDLIYNAVKRGEVSRELIEDRCKRVLRYKYALGLNKRPAPIDIKGLREEICSPESQALNAALAQACITVLRNDGNILPLGDLAHRSIAVVNIGDARNNAFSDVCARYAGVDTYFTLGEAFSAASLAKIRNHDVVVAAVYNDSPESRHVLGQLADMPSLVEVFMVNPYKMTKFRAATSKAKALVLAYDNLPETRAAAAMALFGGIEVKGKLPVNLPDFATMGTGIHLPKTRLGYTSPVAEGMKPSLTQKLDSIMAHAIEVGGIPGGQLLVARHGNVVYDKAFGHITAGGDSVSRHTLYDLASVSKATGTLPGVMKAYDLGLFGLDTPAAEYIPGLKEAGKTFTPREMLYHETGMPASINVYDLMMDTTTYSGKLFTANRDAIHTVYQMPKCWGHKDAKIRRDITSPVRTDEFPIEAARNLWVGQATIDSVMACIYNQKLRDTKAYNYSCLNFCLLLDMEQRLTGQPHDVWVRDSIFAPLGANHVCYQAAKYHPLNQIAPTEKDALLRQQLVHGFVHDETAAMQGGVSGNAGLFSNAGDLAKLCQMWLNGGKYGDVQVLSPATVELFTTSKSPTCRRGLGFDKPDMVNPDWSPTCDEASASVYGHLGFTGTVFWVDPDEEIIFIFLNNRVNPTRDTPVFNSLNLRPELFRQVYKSIGR